LLSFFTSMKGELFKNLIRNRVAGQRGHAKIYKSD
jgi:hypothetical protein